MKQNLLKKPRWSPYLVGSLLGILSWITFAFMGKALGTSTSMAQAAGGIERLAAPTHVSENAYFSKYLGTIAEPKPMIEWQFMLVIFLAIGALFAAKLAKSTFKESVPDLWAARFGSSKPLRFTFAFLGGILVIIGARMAGGCTSGHGLSGGMQLSTSGWIFLAAMFIAGVPTALILYPRSLNQGAKS